LTASNGNGGATARLSVAGAAKGNSVFTAARDVLHVSNGWRG
jgi:hypothetical protein